MLVLDQGRKKLAQKRMNGSTGWCIDTFAVGDAPFYLPETTQTSLVHQVFSKPIDSVELIESNKLRFTFALTEEESNTYNITELALVDSDGMTFSIVTFSEKAKNARREMVFYFDDIWREDS